MAIEYAKLHVFKAKHPSAVGHEERKNVGAVSFSAGDERYVFELSRTDLEDLGLQIQQLFEPTPPPSRRRKGRAT